MQAYWARGGLVGGQGVDLRGIFRAALDDQPLTRAGLANAQPELRVVFTQDQCRCASLSVGVDRGVAIEPYPQSPQAIGALGVVEAGKQQRRAMGCLVLCPAHRRPDVFEQLAGSAAGQRFQPEGVAFVPLGVFGPGQPLLVGGEGHVPHVVERLPCRALAHIQKALGTLGLAVGMSPPAGVVVVGSRFAPAGEVIQYRGQAFDRQLAPCQV